MDKLSAFILGLLAAALSFGVWNFLMGMESETYRCFSVSNEKNLSTFNLQGLKAECHPDVPVRLCRISDIYQIGGKAAGGPMLVVAYNRTGLDTMQSMSWQGLEQVDCPADVRDLREPIVDDTEYEKGNLPATL